MLSMNPLTKMVAIAVREVAWEVAAAAVTVPALVVANVREVDSIFSSRGNGVVALALHVTAPFFCYVRGERKQMNVNMDALKILERKLSEFSKANGAIAEHVSFNNGH